MEVDPSQIRLQLFYAHETEFPFDREADASEAFGIMLGTIHNALTREGNNYLHSFLGLNL
jgi:hypothetical protein